MVGRPRRSAPRLPAGVAGAHLYLLAVSILVLAPYLWGVLQSFAPVAAAGEGEGKGLVPRSWTLDNYHTILALNMHRPRSGFYVPIDLQGAYMHSAIVALSVTLAALVTSTLVGFVLTVYRFRGRETLFVALIAPFMVPFVCVFIPLYVTVVNLRLAESLGALIVTGLWSPIGILVMRQFMEGVPADMLEAARLDGAGEWRLVMQLMVPLCTSALGVLAIYTFMHSWDDLFWPATVLHNPANATLTLLTSYFAVNNTPAPLLMAAALLTILPVVVIYACVARFFIRGIGTVVIQI
jgi:multiple sugar transport system permease protein